MSSKIKVDTIENVAGSGNVSLGSGHNLVVPGNISGTGDLAVNTNKIFVDASTDYIGMGTTSPATATGGGIDIHRNGGSSVRIDDTSNSVTGELQVYSAGLNLATVTNHNLVLSTNNTARMTIDNDGYPLFTKRPMFTAHGASAVSVTGTGTHTYTSADVYNSTEYDPDGHFNPSTGRFTAPVAGRYFFMFTIGVSFSSGYHYTYIRKNNVDIAGVTRNIQQENDYDVQCIQTIINLAQNDFVTTARNNNNVSGAVLSPMFTGWLLG